MDHYDYTRRERRFRESIMSLVGKQLLCCRLQIVSLEINVVYLGFRDGAAAIQGDIGGELLQVVPIASAPEPGVLHANSDTFVL
jgi:hypothetical protein